MLAATPQDPQGTLHLSWSQTCTGKQIWEVHLTQACAESCATKIQNWRPLPYRAQVRAS